MNFELQYGDGPRIIFDSLRSRIIKGEIEAGAEIKIQNLAREYGVSSVMVREAMRILAAEDLIELRPRRSPIVVLPDLSEIIEINQIRLALEPVALRDAIPCHTDATLAQSRALIDQEISEKDLWRKVELNRNFHKSLLAPCGKQRLLETIDRQYEGIARLVQYLVIGRETLVESPHREHAEIWNAVSGRKIDSARDLLGAHIRASTERVMKLMHERGMNQPGRSG